MSMLKILLCVIEHESLYAFFYISIQNFVLFLKVILEA